MHSKLRFSIAVLATALIPAALALGHGGGGGGGGHGGGGGGHGGGGFGGGHGGGFGGGGMHGGGFSGGGIHSGGMYSGGHSISGGGMSGGMRSGGNFSGSGINHGAGNLGGSSLNHGNATFMKNNFPNQASTRTGGLQHSVNRINTGNGFNRGAGTNALNHNSFVRSNSISGAGANHWSHNGNWNHNGNFNHNNNFNRNSFLFFPGFGFGGFGLWGYPYWGYGLGYGGYGGFGYGYPSYGYNYYGYGNGYGGGYGGGYNYGNAYLAAAPPATTTDQDAPAAGNYIDQGELDFKAGKYQTAARDWQHALVEDPKNGAVMMLLAQSMFAMGQYDEAAGATQAGMQMLPEDKWGVVVSNYSQLYGNIQDYTDQLKTLEKARDAKPDSPALRFLLGFHFGYLGYPKHAVKELDKGLTLAPKDLGARKVRGIFAAKWPEAPPLPAAAVEAAKEAAEQKGDAKPADGAQAPPALENPPVAAETGTPS